MQPLSPFYCLSGFESGCFELEHPDTAIQWNANHFPPFIIAKKYSCPPKWFPNCRYLGVAYSTCEECKIPEDKGVLLETTGTLLCGWAEDSALRLHTACTKGSLQ